MFPDDTCAYNHSSFLSEWFGILKLLFLPWKFNLLSFSLKSLGEIGSSGTDRVGKLENLIGFNVRVFLGLLFDALEFVFFVNWAKTFYQNKQFLLLVFSLFQLYLYTAVRRFHATWLKPLR